MIIIGNGLIANAFKQFQYSYDITIFASGVSNSLEKRQEEFQREVNLVFKALENKKKLVYFSTSSLNQDLNNYNEYLKHKANIEKILASQNALVFRLPQVIGMMQNKNNLIPFIFNCIKNEKPFTIFKDSIRNIIDVKDVVQLVLHSLKNPKKYHFPLEIVNLNSLTLLELVSIFEDLSKKKANFTQIDHFNNNFDINIDSKYSELIKDCNIQFDEEYNYRVIRKYYFENSR